MGASHSVVIGGGGGVDRCYSPAQCDWVLGCSGLDYYQLFNNECENKRMRPVFWYSRIQRIYCQKLF